MNDKPIFYDNLVECLKHQQNRTPRTSVEPEILKEFFNSKSHQTTHRTETKNQAAAPPQSPPQTPRRTQPAQTDISAESVFAPIPTPDFSQHKPPTPCAVNELTLDELRIMTLNCRNCELSVKRNNVVFGEGKPNAEVLFIGEAPGADEDAQGHPFVGPAGQLLNRMITAMQLRRKDVYLANIVKCRPPGNRVPFPSEANSCLPYLHRQIELINPKVIVLLGGIPLLHILNLTGIASQRGQWGEYNGIPVMPTFHPSYVLKVTGSSNERSIKGQVWADLQAVMQLIGKSLPKKS
ncbi:MAG: uracil-DNA glycosylase [Victivallaceae bacterium]|nr:uracil-DNA glycosylase [Victivallaceae bacterium]